MTRSPSSSAARSFEQIDEASTALITALGTGFDVAVVLGSGLGALAGRIDQPQVVSYADLPHWPVPGIAGHAGQVVAGRLRGRQILALSGRVHAYEGHAYDVLTFAVRVLGRAGVRQLILTNAAGGIRHAFTGGTLMVIDDHINAMGYNPLVGPNDPRLGRRFPDMSEVYSRRLRRIADEAAAAARVTVAHGVYIGVLGPSYETPAEIRAFRLMGADAVGMSTVPEAIAARHMGMEVLGLSCIANKAADEGTLLLEDDVLATAARVQDSFIELLEEIVARL